MEVVGYLRPLEAEAAMVAVAWSELAFDRVGKNWKQELKGGAWKENRKAAMRRSRESQSQSETEGLGWEK